MKTDKTLRKEKQRTRRSRAKNILLNTKLQNFVPYIAIMLAIAGIFLTSLYGDQITGFIAGVQSNALEINSSFATNTAIDLSINGTIASLKLDGRVTGEGTAKVYLLTDTNRLLVINSTNSTLKNECIATCTINEKTSTAKLEIEIENAVLELERINYALSSREKNNAPEWQGRKTFAILSTEAKDINLSNYFYDKDGDKLEYSIKATEINTELKDGILTIKGEDNALGEYEVQITAGDGLTTAKEKISITILQGIESRERAEIDSEIETELLTKDAVKAIIVLKQNKTAKTLNEIKQNARTAREEIKQKISVKKGISIAGYDIDLLEELNTSSVLIGKITKTGLEKLRKNNLVESIFIDRKLSTGLFESAPLINATNITINGVNLTGSGQSVCVIDTGIDNNHEAFSGRIKDEKCFCTISDYGAGGCCANNAGTDDIAQDDSLTSHGTHTAGIIASDGNIKGIAPNASLVVIKTCDNTGNCAASDVLKAIDYCNEKKETYNIATISGSFGDGQEHNTTNCPTYLDSALNTSNALGIPAVFSAGNEYYTKGINYPACSPFTISTGASTKQDIIADFSNKGIMLDVLAPGVGITSTTIGGYGTKSGTSMATAHAAGAIALIKERDIIENKSHTPETIKEALRLGGKNISGYSRIDVVGVIQIIDSINAENITINGTTEPIINQTFAASAGSAPTVVLNSPLNNNDGKASYRELNISVSDPESDVMNVSVYGDNTTSASSLLAFFQNVANSTLIYNWSSPVINAQDVGLISFWRLDKNISDFTSYGNNGSLVGNAFVNNTGGYLAGAGQFDGNGDYISIAVADGSSLDFYRNMTVSAWVKFNSVSTRQDIISRWYWSTADVWLISLGASTVQKLAFWTSGGTSSGNSRTISANQWYHVVGSFNGTHNLIYVNGVLDSSATSTGPTDETVEMFIGASQSSPYFYFNGTIDEVATWNRSLSASEILDLYRLGNATYYWKADANDGTTTTTSTTNKFLVGADTTKPSVTDVRPIVANSFNTSQIIEISANATDDFALDKVWANLTMPNASTQIINLNSATGDKLNNSYTIPSLAGQYNITFFANDTSNNINNSITTAFNATTAGGNNPPTAPILTNPTNGNTTATNRTPVLTWNASTDPDADQLIYNITLECTGSCAPYTQYIKENTSTTNFTINQSLQVDVIYKWNVTADDQKGGSNTSTTFNFTVASLISATLTNTRVDFGALAINVSADTTANNPLPLRIRNDGLCRKS